jgi:hypothetical protein
MTGDFEPLGLTKGEAYLMNDVNAASVLAWERGEAVAVPVLTELPRIGWLRPRPASVLIVRAGGFGDLIALRPAIEALCGWGIRVGVACLRAYHEALTDSGAEFVEYPVNVNRLSRWQHVVTLENAVERGGEARVAALVDLFADRLKAPLTREGRRPRYEVPEFWRGWAGKKLPLPAGCRGRIGVQMRASAACRSWDFETRLRPAVEMLLKKGYQVLLFDTPGRARLEGAHPGLVAVFADPEVKTWHQTAALLETCDGYLGPDSGLTHLAGALGVPGVALFGAFPSRLRVDCYPSLKALEGQAPCAPCFHHVGATGQAWPVGGPCNKTGSCVAMDQLLPVRVVFQLEKWMEERRGARAA